MSSSSRKSNFSIIYLEAVASRLDMIRMHAKTKLWLPALLFNSYKILLKVFSSNKKTSS